MGIFGRRRVADRPGPTDPVSASADDIARVRALIGAFGAGMQSDAQIRSAVTELAQAGGAISLEERVRRGDAAPPIDRPWQWLVAVADEASRLGDGRTVALVAFFVGMWTSVYEPMLGLADHMDFMIDDAPVPSRVATYTLALRELPALPKQEVVVETSGGPVDVQGVLVLVARESLQLAQAMPSHLITLARQIAG